jgi:hypothetical protein
MMTLQWIDLRCPVCESTFESMAALSPADNGQQYVEPTSRSARAAMLPFLIHVCRRCGYAGGGDDFGDGVEISESLRKGRPMISRWSLPNGRSGAESSLYLAMSRHDAMLATSTTCIRFDYCSSTICHAETYTESTAAYVVASALLFSLSSPAPHPRASLHAFTSITCLLQ